MADLVSILIPVYNARPWLAETLACATKQTWPNKEIIVVDDGSTDGSLEIAQAFEDSPDVQVISQKNQGGCVARNRALEQATGAYIQYLDADDLMNLDKIEVQVRRLQEEPDGAVAVGKWDRFYDPAGNVSLEEVQQEVTFEHKSYYRDYADGLDWAAKAAAREAMFAPHAWLVPRMVAEKAGRWDVSLLVNQDGEYFNRVTLASDGIVFCNDAGVYYRSGMNESVSQRRTPAILKSKNRSIKQITNQILSVEDTARTRRACATCWYAFAYEAYPEVADHVDQAIREAESLSDSITYRPGGSLLYQYVHTLLGWKAAKRFRRWYYRYRYNMEI